ncbi:MAG: hypothetical protein AB1801_06455 [Chloroflexota bacterium]
MKQELLSLFLDCLEPKTLAYLVRDLTECQEDWLFYPDEAPPESLQQELAHLLAAVTRLGVDLLDGDEASFLQLIEQARAEQESEDWSRQRERQERQNWLSDME